jgi:hypothetical protein
MTYSIELTFDAELDIEKFKKSGDKKTLIKIDKLLNELRENILQKVQENQSN